MATAPTKSPFVPKHFTPEQMAAESGGRQFGPDGKALVGRRGNGQLPKPSEQAFGAGQIQIGTARETAKRHGIPWDENKLLTDKTYNLQLADLHKGDLKARYNGDETLAIAAYHSGSGNVDRAIRQHGRANFTAGLGPDGRKYVKKLTGEGAGPGGGVTLKPGMRVVRDPNMTTGKESVMSEEQANPIVNPFKAAAGARAARDNVTRDLGAVGAQNAENARTLAEVQAETRDRTQRVVAEKAILIDGVQAENRALQQRTNPLFQRKAQIRERMIELADMNPIEKGLKGIFNLNYNERYLGRVQGAVDAQLKDAQDDYQSQLNLTQNYLASLDVEAQNDSALGNLRLTEAEQNSSIVAANLNHSKASFGFIGEEVNANENLIRAQSLAKQNYLDGLDFESTKGLLAEAMTAPDGTVSKAGLRIPVGELKDRAMKWENATMSIESSRMALEQNNTQVAQHHANRWAENATEAELRAAAAVNGNYKGMQVPMTSVLNQLENRMQFTQDGIARELGTNDVANLGSMVQGIAQKNLTFMERSLAVGARGKDDPQMIDYSNRLKRLAATSQQLIQSGRGREAAGPLMKEFQALNQELDAVVKSRARALTGGNVKSAPMMERYLSGQQLTRGDAINGMIGFVEEGGLPVGLQTPGFKAAYGATQGAIAAVAREEVKAGTKFTKEVRAARIREVAGAQISKSLTDSNLNEIHRLAPSMARKQGHSMGQIPDRVWQAAVASSDEASYSRIGADHNIDSKSVRQILAGAWAGTGFEKPESDTIRKAVLQERSSGALASTQQALLLEHLDASPAAKNGFVPSEHVTDYFSSDKYINAAAQYEQQVAGSGFADFVASSAGDKGLVPRAVQYGRGLQAVDDSRRVSNLTQDRSRRQAYLNQPIARASAIVGGIQSLNPGDSAKLVGAIRIAFPEPARQKPGVIASALQVGAALVAGPVGGNDVSNSLAAGPNRDRNAQIRKFVMTNKFEDPELERIRKLAAKDWDATGKILDDAFGIDPTSTESRLLQSR